MVGRSNIFLVNSPKCQKRATVSETSVTKQKTGVPLSEQLSPLLVQVSVVCKPDDVLAMSRNEIIEPLALSLPNITFTFQQ